MLQLYNGTQLVLQMQLWFWKSALLSLKVVSWGQSGNLNFLAGVTWAVPRKVSLLSRGWCVSGSSLGSAWWQQRLWWGAGLWLWLQLFWAPTLAVPAAQLLLGAGLSLVVGKLQSLGWALSVSYKLLLGEKDSSAPDKCPWGLTYSPNMLDMMTFGITPKPECQHLCFYLKWWEAIMGEFPAFVSLQRPLPAGPGLSPFNFCCIYGANESFPNRKCLLTLRSIQYLYCHSVTCLCALSLRETKFWVNFLWIWSTL